MPSFVFLVFQCLAIHTEILILVTMILFKITAPKHAKISKTFYNFSHILISNML